MIKVFCDRCKQEATGFGRLLCIEGETVGAVPVSRYLSGHHVTHEDRKIKKKDLCDECFQKIEVFLATKTELQ